MGNKRVPRRQVRKEVFTKYLKDRSISIKELAAETEISERTIRRGLDEGELTPTIVLEICHFFRDDADTLFGSDKSRGWTMNLKYLCGKNLIGDDANGEEDYRDW